VGDGRSIRYQVRRSSDGSGDFAAWKKVTAVQLSSRLRGETNIFNKINKLQTVVGDRRCMATIHLLADRGNYLFLLIFPIWHEACNANTRQIYDKRMNMNNRLITAAMVTGALALSACSSTPTNAQVGATAGAVVGGVVGSALTGSTAGTVIGAGAGAAAGHEIGKRVK